MFKTCRKPLSGLRKCGVFKMNVQRLFRNICCNFKKLINFLTFEQRIIMMIGSTYGLTKNNQ